MLFARFRFDLCAIECDIRTFDSMLSIVISFKKRKKNNETLEKFVIIKQFVKANKNF